MPRLVLVLIVCGLAAVGGPIRMAGVAQTAAAGPDLAAVTLTENDCSFLIQVDEDPRPRLGEIRCGYLDVPEDWTAPDGRRIQIAYTVLESRSDNPQPDPVVYLEGGPGGSALTGIELRAAVFDGMRRERDIVLFDQRGTRLSSPLRCAAYSLDLAFQGGDETVAVAEDVANEAELEEEAPLPPFPAELGDPFEIMQEARRTQAAAAAECAREIAATGVDLRQYNSIASGNDTVALVRALGYDRYNLYGISYGTRLALTIMREHPESGLRSVVLDSTFPPEIAGFEQYPAEPHEVVIQVFADCALDPECQAAYPNLKARFTMLLDRLAETPVMTEDGIPITDRDVIEVMQGLSSTIDAVPYVPRMIAELEQGESDTFIAIVSGELSGPGAVADGEVDAALAAEAAAATPVAAELSPARQFLHELQLRLLPLPEDEAARLFGLLLHLDKRAADRVTIVEFIGRAFPDPEQREARAALFTAVAGMSDADVEELFTALEQTVTLLDFVTLGTSTTQFNSVECNEEIPFQSFDETVAVAQGLEIPELAVGVVEGIAGQFAACEVWPSGRAPAVEAARVASDTPTLILAGAYDFQTPVSWNKSAFVSLPNASYVQVPMSGHGVILYSACAEEIAEAFIDDPARLPDTSCVSQLRPAWILPDDAAA